ncbi:acyl-homoserine-lactone synthase [Jannaschia rubra]|uniref:Acyl-homoserine-lactone synthase n=1 Tax=Jannaschia rubra TaxID=282197 RepID=A0A0M6XRW9_9RHOB|nr:acyl-homoserine-lactone synthase [Jannaschia rubra]CTQ33377.1 Acyl-homoserine-lactone synthase [Jannaschia rubra]SFG00345.1 N-acyl-L-homoserine lactone synthetase [Jannaschia rubra]
MIRYLYGTDLDRHPDLAAAMFRDRAAQFRDRMGWAVTVDAMGWETDDYDGMDPIYVIVEDAAGGHAASMRFLPTTGPTMLADVFPHLMGGAPIRSPLVWECTRFCLSPGAGAGAARRLLLGAVELGLAMGVTHSVGVFDAPMTRIYRRLGWSPEVLGTQDGISAGLWTLSRRTHDMLCSTAGVEARTSRAWLEASFGEILAQAPLSVRG